MKKIISKGLFVILFMLLALPLLQQNFRFVNCAPLLGYYSQAPEDTFTVKKWFDGSFAEHENSFVNDHMGMRPFLLRLNNQVGYSFFRQCYSCTQGNDDCLFYDNYIDAYYGRDYVGYDSLLSQMTQLKAVQDTLARLGKTVIAVYAPCKAWFCPEDIPGKLRSAQMGPNNYKTCLRIGDSLGIRQIDLNSWYLSLKGKEKEVLFPRWGIHWSNYGALLGLDSLVRYIEGERHIRMIHPHWTKVEHTTTARDPDNDVGSTLNLLFPPKTDVFCYPELEYKGDPAARPSMLFVGDSYNFNFIRLGALQHISGPWHIWFVFKFDVDSTNSGSGDYRKMENGYDWQTQVNNTDCIILMNTCKNANILANGFIQAAYRHYFPEGVKASH